MLSCLPGAEGQEPSSSFAVKKPRLILQKIAGNYNEFNPTSFHKIKQMIWGNPPLNNLSRPGALAVGKDRLYIADLATGVVHVWSLKGGGEFTVTGKGQETLQSPVAVAEDPQGRIWVADSGDKKIKIFDPCGRFLSFVTLGAGGGSPGGLTVDSAGGRIWVSDVKNHKILALDFAGKVIGGFGRPGESQGEFNRPAALLFLQNKLYVVDTLNFRIQVFDPQGKFLTAVGSVGDSAGTFGRPKAVAVDGENRLWVGDSLLGRVNIFSPEGGILGAFGGESRHGRDWPIGLLAGMAQNGKENLYVSDSLRGKIWVFKLDY